MLLIAHIVIAISGLISASFAVVRPSESSIAVSLYFLYGTIGTGIALLIFLQSSLLRACLSGLTISALMYAGITIARARISIKNTA